MKTLKIDLNADGQNVKEYKLKNDVSESIKTIEFNIGKTLVFHLEGNGLLILPPVIWSNSIITFS